MAEEDMTTINYQYFIKIDKFAQTGLNLVFVSLWIIQVKKIFNKPQKGLKSDFLWKKYDVLLNIKILRRKIIISLSKMLKPLLCLFSKLSFLKNKAIFSFYILLNRHDICLLPINIQALTL